MKFPTASMDCGLNRIFKFLLFCLFTTAIIPGLRAEVMVNSIGGNTVTVHFDQPLNSQFTPDSANFSIFSKGPATGNGINITNVVVQADQQTVALYLDGPVGEFFAVGVNGVIDSLNNSINATATGITSDFASTSIGTSQDPNPPGEAIPFFRDAMTVRANGSDIGGTGDHCGFVYQKVSGNFEMITIVTRLDNSDLAAKAGLMAREDLTAGSRSVGIYFTPVNAAFNTNQIVTVARGAANGTATPLSAPVATTSLGWLRMTRTNNLFAVYSGTNGSTWTQLGSATIALNSTMSIGVAVTSHKNGFNTTAGFTSFGIGGTKPGSTAIPSVSATIYQRTNLVVAWQRTVSDFCPQVATSLIASTNSSGSSSSNATQWAYVLYPVFDTSLTGTNGAMPTPGRYMVIPMNLFSNSQMFVRLARVERLIPDPLSVTPGIILSQASGSMTTAASSGNTICNTTVDTTTALAQSSVPILCPVGRTYQFTTAASGTTLQTVILVRNFPAIGTSTCDGSYSAGSFKSQVTLIPSSPNTGYTFVAAATPAIKPSACNAIQVQINIK